MGPGSFSITAHELVDYARQALLGLPDPFREAELLVQQVLGLSQAALYAWPEREAEPEQAAALSTALVRRRAREPLAYILGEWEFYGLPFTVTPAVMVPRAETETLVDTALPWIEARRRQGDGLTVADLGTGSGCIAISLACHVPGIRVYASDVSEEVLRIASVNRLRHAVQGRMVLLEGDLVMPLREPVDLIVANLPYVPLGDVASLQPEIRLYEPLLAITPGDDGMALNRRLLAEAAPWLKPGGALMLEMDPGQRDVLEGIARCFYPGAATQVVKDLSGWDRVLVVETGQ